MRQCSVRECGAKHRAKGLCSKHYMAQWHETHQDHELAWRTRDYKNNPEKYRVRNKKRSKQRYDWYKKKFKENPKLYKYKRKIASKKWNASVGGRWAHLKMSAKNRELPLAIELGFYKKLLMKPCHYCGGDKGHGGHGLDRVNNNFGYTKNNVVPCCQPCNAYKNNKVSYLKMVKFTKKNKPIKTGRKWVWVERV